MPPPEDTPASDAPSGRETAEPTAAGSADAVRRQIDLLAGGGHPSAVDVERLVLGVLAGAVDLADFGRWLTACADAGESADEIAGVAAALRTRMLRVPHGRATVADTCGTGGDGSGSFNISTAAAIVAAGAGLPVAKHGNRAVSSRTGSADVLERLGVRVDGPAELAADCLADIGLCFCLAPTHHPAMARVGPLRRSLGRPTVFNYVGPLCNPASATVQVIGVGRAAVRHAVADAAIRVGARRVLVVSGPLGDGGSTLDEVSLFGPTDVIDVTAEGVTERRWRAEDFGLATLPTADLTKLEVTGPEESAAAIRSVLAGERGPRRDVVVVNAAAALWAAGFAATLAAAARMAERSIDDAAAAAKLAALAARTSSPPPEAPA